MQTFGQMGRQIHSILLDLVRLRASVHGEKSFQDEDLISNQVVTMISLSRISEHQGINIDDLLRNFMAKVIAKRKQNMFTDFALPLSLSLNVFCNMFCFSHF